MATKKKAKKKAVFILKNGTRYDVTGETGKYVLCGNTQFRKSARRGEIVYDELGAEKKETEE